MYRIDDVHLPLDDVVSFKILSKEYHNAQKQKQKPKLVLQYQVLQQSRRTRKAPQARM